MIPDQYSVSGLSKITQRSHTYSKRPSGWFDQLETFAVRTFSPLGAAGWGEFSAVTKTTNSS